MAKIRDSKKKFIENSSETSVSINAELDEPADGNEFLLVDDDDEPRLKYSIFDQGLPLPQRSRPMSARSTKSSIK